MTRQHPYRRPRNAGFTLVELLVVLTIVAVMAGLITGFFYGSGYFSDRALGATARQLYALLEAAKVYASANNVDTAVVYGVDWVRDSQSGDAVQVVTSVAVARQVKGALEETAMGSLDLQRAYVPLAGEDGQFSLLRGESVILPFPLDPNVTSQRFDPNYVGFYEVLLYDIVDDDDDPDAIQLKSQPIVPTREYDPRADAANLANTFPAHVFRPAGMLRTVSGDDQAQRERFTLHVGPRPDAPPSERFDPDREERGELDADAPRYVPLFLYKSTGRVRIAERGDP